MPAFGDLFDVRCGRISVLCLVSFLVSPLDGGLDPEIADGKDVRTLQREDQEHLRSPYADAFDRGEAQDNLFVCQVRKLGKVETAFERMLSQVADVRSLLFR